MGIFKNKSPGLNLFSSFKATDHSERLQNTFNEVQTFKRQLLKAETALHTFYKATDELLKTTDDSLSAFPRVWRKSDDAPNAALLPEEDIAKSPPTSKKLGNYPSQQFLVTLEASLQEEVHGPIARWHKQYQHIKTRIVSVEHARLEYDSARKDLGAARENQLKHARKTDGKVDPSLQAAEAQAENILNTKREAYLALEAQVHSELVNLAADAQEALGYVTRALHLEAKCLTDAGDQLREKEAELPVVDRTSSGPLTLGTPAGSAINSPVGTPTAASPTGYGASFRSANFNESPQGSPATPEQVAQAAKEYRSPGATSALGDSGRMGRFDEAAAYAAEEEGAPNTGVANLSVADKPAGGLQTSNTADVSGTNAAVAPASGATEVGQTKAAGVQDSATEFPNAPSHPVEKQEQPAPRTGFLGSIFGTGSPTPAS